MQCYRKSGRARYWRWLDRSGLLVAVWNVRIRAGASTLANGTFAARTQRGESTHLGPWQSPLCGNLERPLRPGSLHRISAGVLERFLGERLVPMFSPAWRPNPEDVERVTPAIRRVTLSENQLVVHVAEEAISPDLLDAADVTRLEDGVCSIRLAFHMRRRQGALILEAADGPAAPAARVDRALLRAMALARVWATQLESGEVSSVKELARQNGLCHNYTARLLPLAYLAPDLTEAVLQGAQPRSVSLAGLTAQPLPWDWSEQRRRFAAIG